jgi:uncharacterized protein
MKHYLPLYAFFSSLNQHDFSLGIDEYKALIEVLAADKENIYFQNPVKMLGLCRLLWFKPNQNAFLFERLFEQSFEYLKEELAEEERQINNNTKKSSTDTNTTEKTEDTDTNTTEKTEDTDTNTTEKTEDKVEPNPTLPQNPEMAPLPKKPSSDTTEIPPLYLNFLEGKSQEQVGSQEENYQKQFGFVKNYVPLTKRQLVQNWRFLQRKSIITHISQEIDIEKTVDKIAKESYLLSPVFKVRKQNKVRLLSFIDHRGSMIAFKHLADTLVKSAGQALGIENEVYYFRNVPQCYLAGEEKGKMYVYKEKGNTFPVSLSQVLKKQFDGILIISDAGTAKGNFNLDRIEATEVFLRELYAHSLKVAWLNPMPEDRWDASAAYIIREMVDMFEANQAGLQKAISIFRGKRKINSAILFS